MNQPTTVGNTFSHDRQAGVGLIEVLIAVLILAVGILGLAQMQLSAKRASFEASQRSLALSYARDILERMRSNPGQATAYATAVTDFDVEVDSNTLSTPNCSTSECDSTALAAYDVWDWINVVKGEQIKLGTNNAGGLLDAFVCINNTRKPDNTGDTVEVIIAWKGVNSLTKAATNTSNDCGLNEPVYDDVDGVKNALRRQINMTTFVSDA